MFGEHPDSGPTSGFSTMTMPLRMSEFLAKKSITEMVHPPYSPDLAPCDSWHFPELKNALKGQGFLDIPDIQCNVTLL
jgi:hypothetical protein